MYRTPNVVTTELCPSVHLLDPCELRFTRAVHLTQALCAQVPNAVTRCTLPPVRRCHNNRLALTNLHACISYGWYGIPAHDTASGPQRQSHLTRKCSLFRCGIPHQTTSPSSFPPHPQGVVSESLVRWQTRKARWLSCAATAITITEYRSDLLRIVAPPSHGPFAEDSQSVKSSNILTRHPAYYHAGTPSKPHGQPLILTPTCGECSPIFRCPQSKHQYKARCPAL